MPDPMQFDPDWMRVALEHGEVVELDRLQLRRRRLRMRQAQSSISSSSLNAASTQPPYRTHRRCDMAGTGLARSSELPELDWQLVT
jgi:hypothetical protein